MTGGPHCSLIIRTMPSSMEFERWTMSGRMSVMSQWTSFSSFLALIAGLAAEHRDGQVAELGGIDAAGALGERCRAGRDDRAGDRATRACGGRADHFCCR